MADPAVFNAILEQNKQFQANTQTAAYNAAVTALATTPWDSSNWSLLPLLQNPIGCLCVVDTTSGILCQGASCTWTVPAGVTKVQFQVWGAGAGTGAPQCCGNSPFGENGAYATVIITATPGDQYILCAGCAYPCKASNASTNTTQGCRSYVTGPGLTGFCADGACSNIWRKMCINTGSACCRYASPYNNCWQVSGGCICASGTWICNDNSCASCGIVPRTADSFVTFHGTATTGTVAGLPGFWGEECWDTSIYGYHTSPPVINICHQLTTGSCCCHTYTSGTCCGGSCTGTRQYPGAGGWMSHTMGGNTSNCGDMGRSGMVRVTWC